MGVYQFSDYKYRVSIVDIFITKITHHDSLRRAWKVFGVKLLTRLIKKLELDWPLYR